MSRPHAIPPANVQHTGPATTKPTKTEDAVSLENLFDDLEDNERPISKQAINKHSANVKKPGNWDAEAGDGSLLSSDRLSSLSSESDR